MKQMRSAWYLIVAVSICALVTQGVMRADAAVAPSVAVPLNTSVATYLTAINNAIGKTTFFDVYNACLPLSAAAQAGTDLGVPVRDNWYRVNPQDLANVRTALTSAATRLLMTYKTQNSAFATAYDSILPSGDHTVFYYTLLSLNDPRRSESDPDWLSLIVNDPNGANFKNVFMGLRKRRDFFTAAIDPAALPSLSSYTTADIQNPNSGLNTLLKRPALPAGAPVSGDTVALRVDVGGARHYLQLVRNADGLMLFASGTDPLDPTSQFKASVDFNTLGLQLTTTDALFLNAENVVGSQGWLPSKRQKATRLGFSGTAFSTTSPVGGKFLLDLVSGTGAGGSLPQYVMRSSSFTSSPPLGYLKVDLAGDLSVRVVDPASTLNADGTFISYKLADATPFTFIQITDLHRGLFALRSVSDVQARVAGYVAFFDGALMATVEDFLLVVAEAQGYLDSCRFDTLAWKAFSGAGGPDAMRTLTQKMRQNMSAPPTGATSATSPTSIATSVYAQQNTAVSALEVSLNAGMSSTATGVRFADGSSVKDALVVISTANGAMLSVGDGGIVSAISRDVIDPSAQFVAEIDASGNVAFRSSQAGNKCLQVGAVSANVGGWLLKARTDISRGSCIRSVSTAAEKFVLVAQGASLGAYAFKNVESQGFVRVDSDNLVRSVDPSGSGTTLLANQGIQTVFTLVQIDSFIKQLSALRLETQDQARAQGYMAAVANILTDAHVNLLLQELNLFVAGAVKSRTQWTAWQTAGLDKALLQWMPTGLKAYSSRTMYSSIADLLATGYVADTTPTNTTGLVAGDVVVLQVSGQDGTYLQVQTDGTFKAVTGSQFFLDPTCQLVIGKNASDSSLIEFQSAPLNNFALRAPDIAVPSNIVADLLTDRLSVLSCAKFDAVADAAADFEIIVPTVAGKTPLVSEGVAFALKRHGSDGYLKIGADSLVRFFDDTATSTGRVFPPTALAASTKISYAVVTSLQKKLTNLRGVADDAARVTGYRGVLGNVITLGDLKLLLFELQYYIQQPRIDQASYVAFKNVQIALGELLTQISTSFANSLKQLDAKTPSVDSLTKALASALVQNIPAAFSSLATADRVACLETMFPSVTTASQAAEFLTLFGITMLDRSMFSDVVLAKMKTIFAAILLNNYTKIDGNIIAGGSQKELDFWANQLAAPVRFSDVLGKLTSLAGAMQNTQPVSAIDDATKTKFVACATALLNLLSTSSDADRASAVSILESAAYTYLNDRRTSILSVDTTIKTYVKPQNVPATYSAQLDALSLELKSLTATTTGGGMDQFVVDATTMVKNRVQALDVDVIRLQGILDDALWHPLVLNQPAVTGSKTRYDAQINSLISLVKVAIPYLDLIQNLTDMLDKNSSFADTDVTYFMARASQLVASEASQKDPSVIDAAVKVLTRGSRYQVNGQRTALDQIISQLGAYRASLSGATGKTYLEKLNDLKSLLGNLDSQAASRALTDVEVQSFFDGLQGLVDGRLDATPSQLSNLIAWLSSSVVSTSRLVFNKLGGIAQIQAIISVLQMPSSIADRFANLQLLLKNNPQFADSQLKLDFIEKAGSLTTPDSRQQAATEKFDIRTNLGQLLTFAKANQFVGDTSVTTGAQLLDGIITKLNAPLNQVLGSGATTTQGVATLIANFTALDFATQVAALDRGVSEIVDKPTATTYAALVNVAVANRISGKDSDIARLKKVILAALRCPGVVDDVTNQIAPKLQASSALLDQPLAFSDYYNAVNVIVSSFPSDLAKITSDTKTLLVTYAQKLADNLTSSKDQSARNVADALLKKLAFNQLDDRSSELLKICDIIEGYIPSEQVGQKYAQAIAALLPQIDMLTASNLPAFVVSLTNLVNRRAEGVSADYDSLTQIIDKLTWHSLVQKETGQPTLKALATLTTSLKQSIPVIDLVNLLSVRLKNQSFTADDIAYFQNKAQALVDQRATITDKAVLDQAINLLNMASRYQMASKRSDLDAMVATLQTQQQSFAQQTYVSYGDQVAKMQVRLTELETKAQAQQLSTDDSAAFLKDLAMLVNARAQGIVANITALTAWLQGVIPQSRFFFVTKGAKDAAIALLAALAQPVAYVDQYNYLVGLLRDYPHFSSDQMLSDFLDKCAYLASDSAKQQAVTEGFDYKKMADILTFAEQNQAQSAKTQVDALIAQLNTPLPAGQVVAKTFSDKLADQEAAIAVLQDSGSNLSDFVKVLEALVASRLDGNEAELVRLSQLLQKAQWNGVIRQSSQSAATLARIQACLDNLAKPIFFTDESAHLIALSKAPLVGSDDQERFITHLTKLIAMKEQAADANALDQIITTIKVVAYNQLQKRTELAPLIAQLDAYRGKMTQQTYVSYSDQITQLQSRLVDLDTKAKAQQLSSDDASAFLKDLETLINARAQGVAADVVTLTNWLQGVIPQSRLFFVTAGAKDKAIALLAALAQSVPYGDQYSFLAGLLRDYSTFSSSKMISDFLSKSAYLASDAGKQQAVSEGFDYKKVTETLKFAENNQMQASKAQIDALIVQLSTPPPAGQVVPKTFSDKLADQEAAIAVLQDSGSNLSDFVKALEALVASRLDGNDAELTRLSQLLQKTQWNAVIRQSSQASALLIKIQTCLDNLAKPVFFADESAHLVVLSKLPLVTADDQDRFIAHLTKLVAIKEQAVDANALDQIITAVKVVAYNQLQKRTELVPLIAQLDAYRGKMTQQTYLSYSDQITQLQSRLTDLDTKAQAQQLSSADAAAFLADLETLINVRAQGVAADVVTLTTWLQGTLPQSRLFFVTPGAKDKAIALLATLAQPVPYNDQYNVLAGLLRDYSIFSAPKMSVDFLAKSAYLASDAGKQQAVAEGFDYKKVVDTLMFAEKNQMQAAKVQIDALIAKLNAPLPAGQVIVQSFNDKLTAQETVIAGLQDSGTNLTNFVTALEALVVSRLDGNDAELARLSQLLQKAQWNGVIRQSSQASALLARVQACLDNLAKPVFFADEAAHLVVLSKLPLVTTDDQDRFIAHLTKLVAMKEQAADASALDHIITAVKVVAYNQLQKRTELTALIAQLDAYRGKMTQQTYVSYSDQVAQLQSRLTDLDTKAKAQQLSPDDAKLFLKDLETLISARAQGVAADVTALTTWLQGVIPQSRLFFVTQGAKDKGAALLLVLQNPVPYVDQYNVLAGLLRDYSTFSSAQMTNDFLAKCGYLVSDAGKQQAQSEGFDFKKVSDLLMFAEQNQLLSVKAQVDALIAKLNAPLGGDQPVVQTFNDKLTVQETAISSLTDAGANLTTFVSALESLVAVRLDGNDTELARFSQLLQKAQWNGAIRQSAQATSLLPRIQVCLDNLAKPILFSDEVTYLVPLSKQSLSIPDQQDRFIAHVTKLVGMKEQAMDATALDQVITAIKVAAYNQLQKRTELPPLISQLDGYRAQMGRQTVLSFTQEIADLNNRSNALTAATVDKFLSDLSGVVKGRFEATADQMQSLTTLVNSVAWLNVVRSDKTKGYSKLVADLIKEVARVPSFAERMQDLGNMLTGTELLNDVLQESFVQKALQLVAVKSNATTAQLKSVIQTLNVAMFNQVKGKAQELQDPLNIFTRYQQTVQLTGGLSFGDRVKALQRALPALTQQGLADFRQQVSDLFDARVDASDDDIAQFKTLLQGAVWNNVVVGLKNSGSTSASDDFTNWYNTVDAPIDFIIWKQSLAQMLLSDTLPDVLQQRFMFKVGKLISAISRASQQDLQDAQGLLTQASYNQLSAHKSELDLAVGKLKDAVNSQAAGTQLSFAQRIVALQAQLSRLSKASVQADIDAFVKNVSDLIDQRVDAINNDLKNLQAWLLSSDVQNNEAIYFHQGADPLVKLANAAMDPVSYGLRVQNLMTLVQNNTVFTDAQKALVQAKVQLLVDQRAQAATESFALSDVVKIFQFLLDRRLDKAADTAFIAKVKNAIYVLQSGSVGTLRLRYGQQFAQVQASLATITAADIPKFVATVKALVDGRADGTQDQVNSLHDWLMGTDVQANKVLFFSPQKASLQTMAATLQTPPPYMERYNNLRQLLQDYPVFDSTDILQEFMGKALSLVKERGRAAAEKLDLQYVKDLFIFAIQNRLANDATSTSTIQQYMDALSTPPDQAVATGSSAPYAQRVLDIQAQFKAVTQSSFNDFVSALSQLVDSRVDGTDADISTLKTWLMSNEVQNSRIVFLQGGLAQIKPLIAKIDVAITFAQRVDNLRVMVQNTATFSSLDQATFFAKVDKLIAERWRAAQENYNIDDVVKLFQFVQVNQFSAKELSTQSDLITTKITALKTAPDQQGPAVTYVTYPDRIAAVQNQFIQIGSMQKDVAAMNQLVSDVNQLVVDRVDGADTDRANLVTFIRSRVLYHQLVYGISNFEQAFQKDIDGLVAPITYGELYANFKKLLTVSVYSDDHKKLFIAKLQALVDNRGDATKASVDLDQLVRDITFAKINKFSQEMLDDQHRTPPDRNPFIKQIEYLSGQLLIAPLATLTSAIAKVQAEITNLSPENWAAAGPSQKSGLLARLRVLANNVDSSSAQTDRDAIDVLLVTARARVFKGDDASIALLNQYRATIQQGGADALSTSSVGVESPSATAPAA